MLRAAAHVHSKWSYDGRFTLDELAAAFARRGYDAVLMAEHDRGFDEARWQAYRQACAEASRDDLLLVPGIEYSDPDNRVHIPVWGSEHFLGEGIETGELLARCVATGGLAVLAHPDRRDAWRCLPDGAAELLLGIETWNRKYDGWAPSRTAAGLLAPGLVPFVGLDLHTARQFFPLAMVLDVDGEPAVETVIEALRARRCRPQAFRMPARRVHAGPGLVAARTAEAARRPLARRLRKLVA